MTADAPGQLLDWDSAFFGLRIARLEERAVATDEIDALRSWAGEQQIDCIYYLAPEDDPASWVLAEHLGMHHVDTRVELSRAAAPGGVEPPDSGITPACDTDRAALRRIAAESHHDSRFFRDPHLPDARCAELYATWIDESCNGFADAVLVTRLAGSAVGYVSCKLERDERGRIGLLAVGPAARGLGHGARLTDAALRWLASAGADRVDVATQQHNEAAIAHYVRAGFSVVSQRRWYHWWPAHPSHQAAPS